MSRSDRGSQFELATQLDPVGHVAQAPDGPRHEPGPARHGAQAQVTNSLRPSVPIGHGAPEPDLHPVHGLPGEDLGERRHENRDVRGHNSCRHGLDIADDTLATDHLHKVVGETETAGGVDLEQADGQSL